MKTTTLRHAFVEQLPQKLEAGILYVSMEFRTSVHLCSCGCRSSVVLPLRPTAWSLTYDGETISMSPSVGNWSFPCRSHYWIRNSRIHWAGEWTDDQIAAGREQALIERGAKHPVPASDIPPPAARGRWFRRFLDAVLGR